MDIRAHMFVFFSRIVSALTEVLGRYIRANDPRMSAGYPSQKLPLWTDFSFLRNAHKHKHFALVRVRLTPGQPVHKLDKKVYVFTSETRKIKHFLLVNWLVVLGLTALSKSLCVKS